MNQENYNEITNDLNKLMNNFVIDKNNKYLDHEIQATISNYLNDFYQNNDKIYEYLVTSNYPDIKVLIKERKWSGITEIEIQRFERLKKLRKLNSI